MPTTSRCPARGSLPEMSTRQADRSSELVLGRPQRAGAVSVRTRLNRVLYSSQRWPWLLLDTVCAIALFQLGLRISPYAARPSVVDLLFPLSAVFAIAFGVISLGLGSYDRRDRFDYVSIVRSAGIAAFLATLVDLAYHYFTLYTVVGRFTLLYGAAASLAGVVVFRSVVAYAVRQHPYRFTVLGSSGVIDELESSWPDGRTGQGLVLVPWSSIFGSEEAPSPARLVDADVAEIVVAAGALTEDEAIATALLGLRSNVPVVDDRTFYGRLFERLPIDDVSKRWILEQGLARPQALVVAAKRFVDIIAAGFGLVVLSPVMALIALAVKLSGPGPAIFVQVRQGRFYRPFRMFKFRSMRQEASVADGFTRVGDVRVTKVGRILRRTRLDELPQLWNVLRGEMSLVGPRPEAIEFAIRMHEELPLYELRYLVRPGITGHAQLKHGYAMDNADDTRVRLSYDLYYLCNYTLRMDLRIILRTVLFLTSGAR
jgi:lipopolysaccharide/colanic/teichoic acid biosynthesis glycosyltransferase